MMLGVPPLAVCAVAVFVASGGAANAQTLVVAQVQVHGNTLTSADEIARIAGLEEGEPFDEELLAAAADRLRGSRKFAQVDVLRRYVSIADPTQILVVIRVDEGPVRIDRSIPGQPRAVRGRSSNLMLLPVLDFEDGYGLSVGARFAVNRVAGSDSRLLFPLTWGGDKLAAVELQKDLSWPLTPRFSAGAFAQRRTHPFFRDQVDRKDVWARGEWHLAPSWRAGATMSSEQVSFLQQDDTIRSVRTDIEWDTRSGAPLPRNAVFARASASRLRARSTTLVLTEFEARGYLALYRESVLVVRALREDARGAVLPHLKSILGGERNLRGYRAGSLVGDTLVAGSLELRVPVTSPLRVAKVGVSGFVDTATVYDQGELADQRWRNGWERAFGCRGVVSR